VGITSDDVRRFVAKRKKETVTVRKARQDSDGNVVEPAQTKAVSNAEINRELQVLKRILHLARKDGRLATVPHIPLLQEDNVRQGFFEEEQYRSVLKHLPEELRPVITFAYITGWRIASEVLPLEWRNVDLQAGEVRLDAGATKNREGRVFVMSKALRKVLEGRQAEREKLKKAGHVTPLVFWRMVAEGRGGPKKPQPILAFTKAWKAACLAAGCPGRIPHDLRRTAVRNMVRAGIPESVAMKMSGHKTRSVFERYNITSPADLRDAARRLDEAQPIAQRR